ncbi:TPR Domain containing protein [Aphelenchoides fujianensis]|nr:TPR Domain containing protein [Aphelenchoides fujianensis]
MSAQKETLPPLVDEAGDREPKDDGRREREEALPPGELERLREAANEIKTEANRKFAEGDFPTAARLYTKALDKCPLKFRTDHSVLLSNRAAAHIKMQKWKEAIEDATAAIERGAPNEKSLERRAFAAAQSDDTLDKALEDYRELRRQFPACQRYSEQIGVLEKRQKSRNERLQKEMLGQLKNLGDMCLRPFGLSTDNFAMVEKPGGGYSIEIKK